MCDFGCAGAGIEGGGVDEEQEGAAVGRYAGAEGERAVTDEGGVCGERREGCGNVLRDGCLVGERGCRPQEAGAVVEKGARGERHAAGEQQPARLAARQKDCRW